MNARALAASPMVRRLLAVAPFLALVLPRLGFTPIYDGAVYGECLHQATEHGFRLWDLNCSGHPSMGYMSLVGLAYELGGGRAWPIILVNVALGVAAILALLAILDRLYPERPAVERLLVAALFGAVPPFAANALNLSVDYGVLVFFVLLLLALVREQPIEAAGAGLFLAFSKEPGAFLFGLAAVAYLVAFTLRRPLAAAEKRRRVLAWAPLVVVPLAFAAYLGARALKHENLVWSGGHVSLAADFLTFRGLDRTFLSFLATTFVINFMWLPTLVVLAGGAVWLGRAMLGRAHPEPRARAELLAPLLLVATWALTRHDTYANVRYFLPLFPLLLWAAFHVVGGLAKSARVGLFSLLLGLFLISAVRTADPVAKRLYGTFPFGDHPMLKVTSLTGECCGYGRDQLVYDLEFTHLDTLLNEALRDLKPTDEAPLAMALRAHWYELQAVTAGPPLRRSLPRAGAEMPPVLLPQQIVWMPERPPTLYWLEFPNVDGRADLATIERFYRVVGQRTYRDGGYRLQALVLALR